MQYIKQANLSHDILKQVRGYQALEVECKDLITKGHGAFTWADEKAWK